MEPISIVSFTLLALSPLVACVSTTAAEISRPRSITETPTVSTVDSQWTVVASAGKRPLEQVGIYLGTLSEYGAQVPESTKTTKKKEIDIWRIVRAETDTFWVGCCYTGTTALLFQNLDPSVTQCVATYDLLPTGHRQRLSSMERP